MSTVNTCCMCSFSSLFYLYDACFHWIVAEYHAVIVRLPILSFTRVMYTFLLTFLKELRG